MLQSSDVAIETGWVEQDGEPSWKRLHRKLQGFAKRQAAQEAELAQYLIEAQEEKLWLRLGYATLIEYIERVLHLGPRAAMDRLRVADALLDLPRTMEAMKTQGLSYSAVKELTRIATTDTEGAWLAAADGKTPGQVQELVSGHRPGDLPDDPTDPDLRLRTLSYERVTGGTYAMSRQARAAIEAEVGHRLDDEEFLQMLFRRAIEPAEGASTRPAHQISVTTCDQCKRGWQNGTGVPFELDAAELALAQCDATLLGSLEADEPARVTSTISPRRRQQVLARDKHRCTVPGCRASRYLDAHHLRERQHGGGNQMWNLTTLCAGHHALLHKKRLRIEGRAPALTFSWPEGEPAPAQLGTVGQRGR